MNELDKYERRRLEDPTSDIDEAIGKRYDDLCNDIQEVSKALIFAVNDNPVRFAEHLNSRDTAMFYTAVANATFYHIYNQAEKEITGG